MGSNQTRYYQGLYEVAAALNSARAPGAVLRSIVENAAKALEAKGCSLMLLTPDKKHLLHTATYGLSNQHIRKGSVSADKSISEALEGKPVAIFDATTDERVQYRQEAKKEGIISILSVPMRLRGEIIGVIRVYSAEPRDFTVDDIYVVSAIANLGAIALENSQLYETVKKDYEALRQEMLEWRAALGHQWVYES